MSLENIFEDFLQKAKEKFGNKFDYSKSVYINNKKKICIICPIHGEFYQCTRYHLKGHGCPKCSIEVTASKKSYTHEDFIRIATKKHKNKFDYSLVKFNKLTDYVTIICPIHGNYQQKASKHIKNGCMQCKNDKGRMTISEVIDKANKTHNNEYDYYNFKEYKNNKQKMP